MNFCQSHLNHHCVHAHNCTNKQHQKVMKQQQAKKHSLQRRKNSKENINKCTNQICQFRNHIKTTDQSGKIQKIFILLQQKQVQLKEIKIKNSQLEAKLSKEINQSKSFQTQIQYYRQQFTKLISNNTIDTKNQIKKRINETAELSIKVKGLQAKNQSLKQEIYELKKSKDSKQQSYQRLKRENDEVQQKNHSLRLKLKEIEHQRAELKQNWEQKGRESYKLEQKWKILISQLKHRCQSMEKQKNATLTELDSIRQQKNILQKKYKNQRQMHQMQSQKMAKENEKLSLQLNEREKLTKDLSQKLKETNEKNILLQQDLKHTKNCFQFTKAEAKKNQSAQKIDQSVFSNERNTFPKQQDDRFSNKQNVYESNTQSLLRKQIAELKAVIKGLQQKSMTNIEEVILKIGASQAFKRLIDQKNEIIKKLMREKAQIKSQAILSH